METQAVIRLFGSQAAVAKVLGLSRSAIHQWGDEVPKLRQYHLREKHPHIDEELENMRKNTGQGA